MKRRALVLALGWLLVGVFAISSCSPTGVITGSGPVVTQNFDFTDFTGVEISSAFKFELVPSSNYSVSVTANENLFPYIDINKSGSILKIGIKGVPLNIGSSTLQARVTLPELSELDVSGASQGTAMGFKTSQDFKFTVSGASRLDLDIEAGEINGNISGASRVNGRLVCPEPDIEVSGASQLELEGDAENVVIYVSGASKADMAGFPAVNCYINLNGASEAVVNVSGKLDADLSGASELKYLGSPSMGEINIADACRIGRK